MRKSIVVSIIITLESPLCFPTTDVGHIQWFKFLGATPIRWFPSGAEIVMVAYRNDRH